MLMDRFLRRVTFLVFLGLWSFIGSAANAQTCRADAPRYSLQDDVVRWSITIVSGRSCTRGVRFKDVQFGSLKLVSPPRFGRVQLEGSGSVYSSKADFHGQDEFSLIVAGAVQGTPGNSTIHVTVSVNSSSDTSAGATPSSAGTNPRSEGAQ